MIPFIIIANNIEEDKKKKVQFHQSNGIVQ